MLYCLHCPTIDKVFLLLLLLYNTILKQVIHVELMAQVSAYMPHEVITSHGHITAACDLATQVK